LEVAPRQITVNNVAPGAIDTPGAPALRWSGQETDGGGCAAWRYGQPDVIAQRLLSRFLWCSYVTARPSSRWRLDTALGCLFFFFYRKKAGFIPTFCFREVGFSTFLALLLTKLKIVKKYINRSLT
jgi:hypothetical protein